MLSGIAHHVPKNHLVIEMLRELDEDMWETHCKVFSVQIGKPLDGGRGHAVVTMVKKKNGKLTMSGFRPIAMLPTMYRFFFSDVAAVGGPGNTHQT